VTAPLSLRLDAVETVLLQLFGFMNEVKVYVFLKTSMAPDHVVLAQEVVTLNAQNHHQATAQVQVRRSTSGSVTWTEVELSSFVRKVLTGPEGSQWPP